MNKEDDIMKIKDVFDTIYKNINPLTKEVLKKILLESTTKANPCENPVLVSVDEIEKEDKAYVGEVV